MCPVMVRWLAILIRTLRSAVRTHLEWALENLALRQQLAVWKARQPRPRLTEVPCVGGLHHEYLRRTA
jgi:hypothetical protein